MEKIEKEIVPGFKSFFIVNTTQNIVHFLALGVIVLGIAFLIARDTSLGIILLVAGIIALMLKGLFLHFYYKHYHLKGMKEIKKKIKEKNNPQSK